MWKPPQCSHHKTCVYFPPQHDFTPILSSFQQSYSFKNPFPYKNEHSPSFPISTPNFIISNFLSAICINYEFTLSSLPFTFFFASALSFLHPSSFLSFFFFLISFFPLHRFFLSFLRHASQGASLPSPHFLRLFSNLSMPSKNFPRRLHISFPFFFVFFLFSMLVLLCPSFIPLFPFLAPPKRRSEYMHVLKAVLLFPSFHLFFPFFCFCLFFLFFVFVCFFCLFFSFFFVCVVLPEECREYTRAQRHFHSFPFVCHLYLDTLNHLPIPTTDPKNFPIAQNNLQQTGNKENCRAEQKGVPTLHTIQLRQGANEVCQGNKNRGQYAPAPKARANNNIGIMRKPT